MAVIGNRQIHTAILLLGFILGSHKGFVALWRGVDPAPIRVFPYSIASLPPADQKALEKGIPVHQQEDLLRLLEDYLS